MGIILQARFFAPEQNAGLLKPIIYCNPSDDQIQGAFSINGPLSVELIKIVPERRTLYIERSFRQIVSPLPDNILLKNFDVLFNPNYRIDILKMMIQAYKYKPFSLIWPGRCRDKKLFYADEGYSDYKVYPIEDYDITCII